MKKSLIMILMLSGLLLVTVMAVSVSAAPSLAIGDVTFTKDIANNIVTFTVPYTANDVDQVTVLAIKGTADKEPVATENNIVYINQQGSAVGNSFTFNVPYDKFSAEEPYCWIKIGGTSIATAQSNEQHEIWTPAVSTLVYGDVNNDSAIDSTDAILVIKYASTLDSGKELDSVDFPDGTFKAGNTVVADVNNDGAIDSTDAILIIKYASTLDSGKELDPVDFPDGKFKADNN